MGLLTGTKWDRPPHCDRCDKPETECTCPPPDSSPVWLPAAKQTARIAVEKRAKGKLVTLIRGLSPSETDFPALLTRLKNSCGAGGAIREDELEIQGDHRERVQKILAETGYRVR